MAIDGPFHYPHLSVHSEDFSSARFDPPGQPVPRAWAVNWVKTVIKVQGWEADLPAKTEVPGWAVSNWKKAGFVRTKKGAHQPARLCQQVCRDLEAAFQFVYTEGIFPLICIKAIHNLSLILQV